MKELFILLIVYTYSVGIKESERKIFLGTDYVYEEVEIIKPSPLHTGPRCYQVIYDRLSATYIDTSRNYKYVDTVTNIKSVNSHIWELKNKDYVAEKAELVNTFRDSLLQCKVFHIKQRSNPESSFYRENFTIDLEVITCRISTDDIQVDSILNLNLENVLEQELGGEIHEQLDKEFLFGVKSHLQLTRGGAKAERVSTRKEIKQSGRINIRLDSLIDARLSSNDIESVSAAVFFDYASFLKH